MSAKLHVESYATLASESLIIEPFKYTGRSSIQLLWLFVGFSKLFNWTVEFQAVCPSLETYSTIWHGLIEFMNVYLCGRATRLYHVYLWLSCSTCIFLLLLVPWDSFGTIYIFWTSEFRFHWDVILYCITSDKMYLLSFPSVIIPIYCLSPSASSYWSFSLF